MSARHTFFSQLNPFLNLILIKVYVQSVKIVLWYNHEHINTTDI